MKEEERLEFVSRVNTAMEEFKKIEKYRTELNSLMEDEKVKRYLFLQEQIANYAHNENLFNGELEKMIYHEFICGFNSRLHGQLFDSCNHDIWIYTGSYAYSSDPYNCTYSNYYLCSDEYFRAFSYNEYECLECGKKVRLENWEEFERTHFVLKDRNQVNANYYREVYYLLLYTNSVDVAQQKVIDEFNQNKDRFSCPKKKTK